MVGVWEGGWEGVLCVGGGGWVGEGWKGGVGWVGGGGGGSGEGLEFFQILTWTTSCPASSLYSQSSLPPSLPPSLPHFL